MELEGGYIVHERIDLAARHRVAHRDIHIADFRRYRVQERYQEALVGEHDGRIGTGHIQVSDPGEVSAGLFRSDFLQYFRQILRLSHRRRHTQDMNCRASGQCRLVGWSVIQCEGLRKFHDILRHEHRGAVHRVAQHCRRKVPAELRDPGITHLAHRRFLAFVQCVESHEHKLFRVTEAVGKDIDGAFRFQPFRKFPICHAFIRHPLLFQCLVEVPVERIKQVPNHQEAFLHIGVFGIQIDGQFAAFPEMAYKMLYRFELFRRQIRIGILDFLEVGDIGIKTFRVGEIFVRIVEIAQYHVAPKYEIVQRLRLAVQCFITIVQFQKEVHPVSRSRTADAIEKFVHRQCCRGNDGLRMGCIFHAPGNPFVEKHHGTPVGEDETEFADIIGGIVVMPGNLP